MTSPVTPSSLFMGAYWASLAGQPPVWQTAAGTIAQPLENSVFSATLVATHPISVSYSLNSGSLPPGLTLNTATGIISGTAPEVVATTGYSFVVRAIGSGGAGITRSFVINVTNVYADPDVVAHLRFDNNLNDETGQRLVSLSNVTGTGSVQFSASTPLVVGSRALQGFVGMATPILNDADTWWPTGDMTIEFFSRHVSTHPTVGVARGPVSSSSVFIRGGVRSNVLYNELNYTDRFSYNDSVLHRPVSWHHVAIVRSGTTNTLFVDGLLSSNPSLGISGPLRLLNEWSNNGSTFMATTGTMDELRISRIARYSRNFIAPTAPLTTTVPAGTVTFLAALNAAPFIAATGETITNSNVVTSGTGPFGTGSAATFTRSGNATFLHTPLSGLFANLTSNFTIEMWVNLGPTGSSGLGTLFSCLNRQANAAVGSGFLVYYSAASNSVNASLRCNTHFTNARGSAGYNVEIFGNVQANQWIHLAFTRGSQHMCAFANGTYVGAVELGVIMPNLTEPFVIGAENINGDNRMNGRIADIRVTNAIIYPFVPPSAPFPA